MLNDWLGNEAELVFPVGVRDKVKERILAAKGES